MLGVTQLTDVAQVIRAVAETLPNHRFETERYLRERISMRIDRAGYPGAADLAGAHARRRAVAARLS